MKGEDEPIETHFGDAKTTGSHPTPGSGKGLGYSVCSCHLWLRDINPHRQVTPQDLSHVPSTVERKVKKTGIRRQ